MDLFYLPDVLRGLNTNPTLKMLDKLGATKKKGEKFITIEEFYPIYSEVSNSRIVTLKILLETCCMRNSHYRGNVFFLGHRPLMH